VNLARRVRGDEEAINRGCKNRDSRSLMLLQLERCGLKVEVDPHTTH
jgi:hypothetical protein